MKKLLIFLMVVGLVMVGSGKALVLAQTTYNLYATSGQPWIASDFDLQYEDNDGDQKFSLDELISFSGVTYNKKTYTEIIGVPANNFQSPFTDGGVESGVNNPRRDWWYFNEPSSPVTMTCLSNPNHWTYYQLPEGTAAVPGKAVVRDSENDLLLRRCNPSHPLIPCSLPPPPLPDLPGYFDIKSAQITQVTQGLVYLSIELYEPIPAVPYISPGTPYGFISYIWQFAGGCVNPQARNKDSISVVWTCWEDNQTWEWRAYWYVITGCSPRAIERGDPVPFSFTPDGIKVWVPLASLLTAIDPDPGYLEWHVAVRRIPFIYSHNGIDYPYTSAVDYAPNVMQFIDESPYWEEVEDFATWEPR